MICLKHSVIVCRRELDECLEKNCAGLLGKLSMGLRAGLNCSAEELNNCYR